MCVQKEPLSVILEVARSWLCGPLTPVSLLLSGFFLAQTFSGPHPNENMSPYMGTFRLISPNLQFFLLFNKCSIFVFFPFKVCILILGVLLMPFSRVYSVRVYRASAVQQALFRAHGIL